MACHTASVQRRFSDQQWVDDLHFVVTSITDIHPNPFHAIREETFRDEVAALNAAIPHLTDNQIVAGLLRLVSMTEDWHTQIISRNLSDRWFPIRIEQLQDGLFVTAVASAYEHYLGARVLRLGRLPADAAFDKVQDVTAHDNPHSQRYFAPMLLTMSSVLDGLGLIESVDTLTLGLRSATGQEEEAEIAAVSFDSDDDLSWYWLKESVPSETYATVATQAATLPLYWRNTDRNYWFESLDPDRAVYVGFNMTLNDEKEKFDAFCDRLWDFVDQQQVDHLVIDLRHNLGGDNSIVAPLIDGILNRNRLHRHGGLFVLIGPKNVSASSHIAAWLERQAHPIFVGEPTGARVNQYADPEHVRLPNSQLRLMVSKRYWQNGVAGDDRPWIEPHIAARFSSEDILHLRDPVMDRVIDLIRYGQM